MTITLYHCTRALSGVLEVSLARNFGGVAGARRTST